MFCAALQLFTVKVKWFLVLEMVVICVVMTPFVNVCYNGTVRKIWMEDLLWSEYFTISSANVPCSQHPSPSDSISTCCVELTIRQVLAIFCGHVWVSPYIEWSTQITSHFGS